MLYQIFRYIVSGIIIAVCFWGVYKTIKECNGWLIRESKKCRNSDNGYK